MTDREAFRNLISKRQHDAEEALVGGDVKPRLRMWSHRDPVTLFAGLGPSKSGWSELEPTFRAVAARLSAGHDVTYELISFDVSEDLGMDGGLLALHREHRRRFAHAPHPSANPPLSA